MKQVYGEGENSAPQVSKAGAGASPDARHPFSPVLPARYGSTDRCAKITLRKRIPDKRKASRLEC